MPESSKPIRPVLSVSINLQDESFRQSLHSALTDIAEQDSSLKVEIGSSYGQITLLGMSETHLELVCERIWNEYKIEIEVSQPQVLYLETIRKEAEAEGKYIRQTGGQGNFGHCKIHLTLGERSCGYRFVNTIENSAIPEKFIESIDQGIREALDSGILAGYPIVDVTVTLFDGSYHETDSNETAYKIAAAMAFKEAARKANPVLLEPVMAVETETPEEYMGLFIHDLNNRRGRIEDIESRDGSQVIHATVPLSEMLTSSRHGRADYPMHFARYEPVLRGKDSGDEQAGVPALRPKLPTTGNRSAAVPLPTQFD